ncbi:MAG: hypothetical protein QXW18_06815 [Candidatus Bathyarchaeia archaeon]
MDRKRWACVILLVIIIATSFTFKMAIFARYPFPPGADPGLRVKNAVNIVGKGERNLPYPGFDISLSILWIVGSGNLDAVVTFCEIFATLLCSLLALPMYILARNISKRQTTALCAALIAAFYPSIYELLSFGSYTSVLALFLIPMLIAFITNDQLIRSRQGVWAAGLLTTSLILMHYWSFALYVGSIALFIAFTMSIIACEKILKKKLLPNGLTIVKTLFLTSVIGVLISGIWWAPISSFLAATSPTSSTETEAGMRGLSWRGIERFFSPPWIYQLFAPIAILAIAAQKGRGENAYKLLLVLTWFISPILAMIVGSSLGVPLDYRRLWYYPIQPAIALTSIGLAYAASLIYFMAKTAHQFTGSFPKFKKTNLSLSRVCEVFFIIVLIGTVAIGLADSGRSTTRQFQTAAKYYQHIYPSSYAGLLWIRNYVPHESEIAAGGAIGWWIPGVTLHHVTFAVPLAFVSIPAQIPKAEAANILLSDATKEAKNGLIRVGESGPYWAAYNPEVDLFTGTEYNPAIYLNDSSTRVVYNGGLSIPLSDFERRVYWLSRNEQETVIETVYTSATTTIKKTVTLYPAVRFAQISFQISDSEVNKLVILVHRPEDQIYNVAISPSAIYTPPPFSNTTFRWTDSKWFAFYDEDSEICAVVVPSQMVDFKVTVHFGFIDRLRMEFPVHDGRVTLFLGAFLADTIDQAKDTAERLSVNPLQPVNKIEKNLVATWDYLEAAKKYAVKYLVTRDPSKFAPDPNFNLLYSGKIWIIGLR